MQEHHGTITSYTIGFILSIIFTIAAIGVIVIHDASGHQTFTHAFLRVFVLICAVIQVLVQLIFFLHIQDRKSRKTNIAAIAFTAVVLIIIVGGSLWITNHLNTNMMPMNVDDVQQYLIDQQG
jgi:cytochrome o ubiquinol oxidase operon protein cyoD